MANIEALYKPSDIAFGANQEQKDRGWNGLIKAVLIERRERIKHPNNLREPFSTQSAAISVLSGNPSFLPEIFAECIKRGVILIDDFRYIWGPLDNVEEPERLKTFLSERIEKYLIKHNRGLRIADSGRSGYTLLDDDPNFLKESMADEVEVKYGLKPLDI